jgi:hypothetical protein
MISSIYYLGEVIYYYIGGIKMERFERVLVTNTSSHHAVDRLEYDNRVGISSDASDGGILFTLVEELINAVDFHLGCDWIDILEGNKEILLDWLERGPDFHDEEFGRKVDHNILTIEHPDGMNIKFQRDYSSEFSDDIFPIMFFENDADKFETRHLNWSVVEPEQVDFLRKELNKISKKDLIDLLILNCDSPLRIINNYLDAEYKGVDSND